MLCLDVTPKGEKLAVAGDEGTRSVDASPHSFPAVDVDVTEREDGRLRVVEIWDSRVSDLVGWRAPRFAELWRGPR